MKGLAAGLWVLIASPAIAQGFDAANCLSAPYTAAATPVQTELARQLSDLRDGLAEFPSLTVTLDAKAPLICLEDGIRGARAYYAPGENAIVIDSGLAQPMREIVLLHELRHLEQFARDACPNASLSREAHAAAVLAMEADASAVTALVAWRWHEGGRPGPWEALAAWAGQRDIAARVAAAFASGGSSTDAAAAAFDQWYADPARRDSYWHRACSAYLDRQDATHARAVYGALDPSFWAQLCVLPDGLRYPCASPD